MGLKVTITTTSILSCDNKGCRSRIEKVTVKEEQQEEEEEEEDLPIGWYRCEYCDTFMCDKCAGDDIYDRAVDNPIICCNLHCVAHKCSFCDAYGYDKSECGLCGCQVCYDCGECDHEMKHMFFLVCSNCYASKRQ